MSQLIKTNTQQSLSTLGQQMLSNVAFKPYEVRITREKPACFVFMIDQSGSMSDAWGNDNSKTKAEMVALYVNNALNELINICQKAAPEPLPYFEIAVVGYGQNRDEAQLLWEGDLEGKTFVTPAQLKQNPTGNKGEIEVVKRTFKGESIVKIPVSFWFSPIAKSLTPMGAAFDLCTQLVSEWTAEHPNCFPPIVINITDGEQTDCEDDELLEKAYCLRQTATNYGETLLFNIHISSDTDEAVLFPESKADLPDNQHCHLLYQMSSQLPDAFRKRIAHEIKRTDLSENTNYVAMTFQASVGDLTKCLDIGTKTITTS